MFTEKPHWGCGHCLIFKAPSVLRYWASIKCFEVRILSHLIQIEKKNTLIFLSLLEFPNTSIFKCSSLPDAQVGLGSFSVLEAACARNCELISQLGPAVESGVMYLPTPFPYVLVHQGAPSPAPHSGQLPPGPPQFTFYLYISDS